MAYSWSPIDVLAKNRSPVYGVLEGLYRIRHALTAGSVRAGVAGKVTEIASGAIAEEEAKSGLTGVTATANFALEAPAAPPKA